MPEYLAPDVYVEEIDTGNKPIDGVSTSTAAMLGVTERGPVDVAILVTSYGEYRRWFGERLPISDFSDSTTGVHCYLPNAVEGFFQNSGKRVYITRVLDPNGAANATLQLFDRGSGSSVTTLLLRGAGEATGTAGNPPPLYVLDPTGLNAGDWVRIGDGSAAEYRQIGALGTASHIPLAFALDFSHESGQSVDQFTPTADPAYTGVITMVAAVPGSRIPAGALEVTLTSTKSADITHLQNTLAIPSSQLIQISGVHGEYHFVTKMTIVDPLTANVTLEGRLSRSWADGTAIVALKPPPASPPHTAPLDGAAGVGDGIVFVDSLGGAFNVATDVVLVHAVDPTHSEVRRIGVLGQLTVAPGAFESYPAGSVIDKVDITDDDRPLAAATAANDAKFTLATGDVVGLSVGDQVTIDVGTVDQDVTTIQSISGTTINVSPKLNNAHGLGAPVTPGFSLKQLSAAAPVGARAVSLGNRISLSAGDVIRIGIAPNEEYATITSIPNRAATAPDAGTVLIDHPLLSAHPVNEPVRRQKAPHVDTVNPAPATTLALDASVGATQWILSDIQHYGDAPLQSIRVTTPLGNVLYHRISAAANATAAVSITVQTTLERAHLAGSVVIARTPLIEIDALDPGSWGDRLRISVEDESPGLVSRTQLATVVNPTHIRLASVAGVERGTIIELLDPDTSTVIDVPLKVIDIDRTTNYTLTLDGTGLTATQISAQTNAVLAGKRLGVRSREFRLTVLLMHAPDPALPSRSELVLDTEVFRNLSMDSRHSRYFQSIIGQIGGPLRLSDRRPEGESWYIRTLDLNPSFAVNFGPETLVDVLPNGRTRPARHALEGGNDSLATLTDAVYVGDDNVDPEKRTGLFTFNNVDEISIVAVPGRTNPVIQGALIDHCELNRFRFAVLDGPPPPDDALADVQDQRQQFDTKYAAIYHPWLLIDDPFPVNLGQIAKCPIPPAGHVLGVYARTDVERGVHKAPANEAVNGILGLQRILNKQEQEILNPYPVNINVIRDFRVNDRGIRIWGGRVITSDTDWKYVNVRRLLIFIEKSIEIGLQWVVFEPNAEPLWARVRRTIGNFLTTVWRNGALEGTKPEEAYFVKCDRTTMTQTDIDNGRLIVIVGVAPVKPAEFVIVRIGLFTAQAS
jgi:phage tail sheath protein FI